MKSAVKANLTELSEEIHRIVDALDHEEEYCLLREITNMRETFAQIESLAASFYLECYLSPYTNKYQDLSDSVQNLSRKQHGALMVTDGRPTGQLGFSRGSRWEPSFTGSLLESIFYPGGASA